MQRLFFGFPAGLPGAGLFLLRIAIGLSGLYEAHLLLTTLVVPFYVLVVLRVAVFTVVFSVLIGLTTPIASFGLGIGAASTLLLMWSPWSRFTQNDLILLNLTMMAIVNAAVGPGAFSVDARLFGRREIVFPD